MNRREFMNWIGTGTLAASLPAAIAACQPDTASVPTDGPAEDTPEAAVEVDSTPRPDGFAAIGTVAELDQAGSVSDKSFQGQQVLVVRDPVDSSALIAVNSLCTHQGCSVDWAAGSFACPCHGSSFNPDGTVASGPATDALGTFEAKVEDDLVLVKIES
ncbi:Rieske (2Fe-2S) protein [Oscillatoria sp. CS-180]|uniref:QcrA and Rieske domain-containing protein n=1 Tax=Oscillatoria sp. CS-180 TaxID=3021720 RepID=UPI00232E262F|nr:Rieske (2Fe-2S) protein [Oscillatoria sp. CS-180]MDB9527307.1 Rieske (2Fe-2S) protein [Oscillatoria sp. CS-180]